MSQTKTLSYGSMHFRVYRYCIASLLWSWLCCGSTYRRRSTRSLGDKCIIWGLGVALAVYLTAGTSGAHLNPAVTVAFWLFACALNVKVIPYIVAQMLGGFCRRCCVLYVLQFIYRLRTGQRNCTRITRKPLYCGRLLLTQQPKSL